MTLQIILVYSTASGVNSQLSCSRLTIFRTSYSACLTFQLHLPVSIHEAYIHVYEQPQISSTSFAQTMFSSAPRTPCNSSDLSKESNAVQGQNKPLNGEKEFSLLYVFVRAHDHRQHACHMLLQVKKTDLLTADGAIE